MIINRVSSVVSARVTQSNTPIQQIKSAGQTLRGQTTQGLPLPVSNLSVAVIKNGNDRTLRVTFTENAHDPYFTDADLYIRFGNNNPTLIAMGTSPIIVTVPRNDIPAIVTISSSGNWAACHWNRLRVKRYRLHNIEAEIVPIGLFPQEETELFSKWMWRQRELSNFDAAVLSASSACVVKVTQDEKSIAYMPIQTVICLESLCNDESLTKSQLTLAVYQIHLLIKKVMKDSGMMEAFFTTRNDTFAHLCEGQGWKRHLYDPEKKTWLMKLQIEATNAA